MPLETARTVADGVEEVATDLRQASRVREGLEAVRDQVRDGTRPLMMLGPFMFSAGTAAPGRVNRRNRYRWPAQEVVGARPKRQFVGAGEERIEIDGTIYPHYKGGLRQVQLMRELAGVGRPQLLVDGLGVVYGLFAIEEVEETGTVYDQHGAPRRIEFRLALVHSGEDD